MTDKQGVVFNNQLEIKSRIQLDGNKYGIVTVVDFNQDSTMAYLGTSKGFVAAWDLKDAELDTTPMKICKDNKPITKIDRFYGVNGCIFLCTVNNEQAYIYTVSGGDGLIKKSKEKKLIDFELDGRNFENYHICNTHIAHNGRFFTIGLVNDSNSLFGIFSFNKSNC